MSSYEVTKVDERNSIAISESMNLFTMPLIDIGVSKVRYIEYKPLNQLNQDVGLEFEIPNNGNNYIDLRRTYLICKVRIKKDDGTELPESTGVDSIGSFGPVNNFLHAMYSQVDIYLQKQLLTTSNSNYAYESFFNTLLKYDAEAMNTHLQSQLFYKDTGSMDSASPISGNRGLTLRAMYSQKSNIFEVGGPIMSSVAWVNRYILQGVEIKIRLWPTAPAFHLMSSYSQPGYKTEIVDASLSVCMVTPSPQTLLAHQQIMEKKKWTAVYPYLKSDVKKYSISKGHYCFSIDNVYLGSVPSRLILGMVSEQATVGSYTKNPYNFRHYFIKNLSVCVDGESVPQKALQMKFGDTDQSSSMIEAYLALYGRERFTDSGGEGLSISRSDFANGFTLFAFDLEPDVREDADGSTWPTFKKGNLRIQMDFEKPLPESVSLIIYATFPSLFKIDSSRAVTIVQ